MTLIVGTLPGLGPHYTSEEETKALNGFITRIDEIYIEAIGCFQQTGSIDHLVDEVQRINDLAQQTLSRRESKDSYNAKIAEFNAFLHRTKKTDAIAKIAEDESRQGSYPEKRIAAIREGTTPPLEEIKNEHALAAIAAHAEMMIDQLNKQWEVRDTCAIL